MSRSWGKHLVATGQVDWLRADGRYPFWLSRMNRRRSRGKWINSDINTGGKQMTVGTPLVVDNYVFVSTQNNKLYKLDKNTGAIVKEAKLAKEVRLFLLRHLWRRYDLCTGG